MPIVTLKRRYWVVLGAALGLAIGVGRGSERPEDNHELRRPLPQAELVRSLASMNEGSEPLVTQLTVFPRYKDANYITGFTPTPTARGMIDKPFFSELSAPLQVSFSDGSSRQYDSILSFLSELSSKNARLEYRFAWWRIPTIFLGTHCVAGILLLGFMWPLLFRLIVGHRLEIREIGFWELFWLHFRKGNPSTLNSVAAVANSSFANSNRGEAAPMGQLAVGDAGNTPSADLDTQTLSGVPPQSKLPQKRYRGDFYPVEAPKEMPKPSKNKDAAESS